MTIFKKKKLYKVVWIYSKTPDVPIVDLVKAHDVAGAWTTVKNAEYPFLVSLVSIEEFNN